MISNSLEWNSYRPTIVESINTYVKLAQAGSHSMPTNQLFMILWNVDTMVGKLSEAEVKYRRHTPPDTPELDRVNAAIQQLEELIFLQILAT